MSRSNEAFIVIHRSDSGFARLGCHRVTIDGRLAGYTNRISPTTEFSVEPGAHTVEVAVHWEPSPRSQPLRLELAPGSRTDVRIAPRPGVRRRFRSGAPKLLALVTVLPLLLLEIFGHHRWWHTPLMMVGLFCFWAVYNRLASLLVKDYWTLLILEPMSG